MPKKRSFAAESLAQIKRIRAPHKKKTIEEVIEHERKTNTVFLAALEQAPAAKDQQVLHLLAHVHTENELDTVGVLVEYLAQQDSAKAPELAAAILTEVAARQDRGCIGILFSMLKKLLIQHWALLRPWVDQTVSCSPFGTDDSACFGAVLAEVFKAGVAPVDELVAVLGRLPVASQRALLAGLLLNRAGQLCFGVERHRGVFAGVSVPELSALIDLIAERAADEHFETVISFLGEAVGSAGCNELARVFTAKQVLAHASKLSHASVSAAVERLALTAPNSAALIVEQITDRGLLYLISHLAQISQRTANTEAVFSRAVAAVTTRLPQLYATAREHTLLVGLGIEPLSAALLAWLGLSATDTLGAFFERVLQATSDEQLVATAGAAVETACTGGDPAIPAAYPSQTTAQLLSRYLIQRRVSSFSGLVDAAVCTLAQQLGQPEIDLGALTGLIGRETAGTPVLSLVMRQLAEAHPSSAVLPLLHQHSLLKPAAAREHCSLLDRVLRTPSEPSDQPYLAQYFAAVLDTLPYLAQKKLVRDKDTLSLLWSRLVADYRFYESTLLAGLLGHESMLQALPNGLAHYSTEQAACLAGDKLFFVVFFALDTQYPLQYLQVLDRQALLLAEVAPEHDLPTKWAVQRSGGALQALYDGTVQPIQLDAEIAATAGITPLLTDGGSPVTLTPSLIVSLLRRQGLRWVERHNLRDVAVHALLGEFVCPKKETVASLQRFADKSDLAREVLVKYMWGQIEYRQFASVFPELAGSFPKQHQKPSEPAGRPKGTARQPKEAVDTLSGTDRTEQIRKGGLLIAQVTASKKHLTCDIMGAVAEIVAPFSEEEKAEIAGQFFKELNLFWKRDREKISKNFDFVISVIATFFSEQPLLQVQSIVLEYLKCTRAPSEEGYALAAKLFSDLLRTGCPKKASHYLAKLVATDVRLMDTVVQVLGQLPESVQHGVLNEALGAFPEDSVVFLAALRLLAAQPVGLPELRTRALEKALGLLDSRNEETVLAALSLLAQTYTEADPQSKIAETILSGALRTLQLRTKLDQPGIAALSIVQHALFAQQLSLSQYEKEELLVSVKYDLFYYRDILVHLLDELPVVELIEIIGKISTPEAKSARPAIRKAILQYTPQEKEGIRVFTQLLTQAKTGSVPERLFVLDIISETLAKYAQGAWLTVFLQLAEALANESTPAVEQQLLRLIAQAITASTHKKQIKEVYQGWKTKPKLRLLVNKLSSVFVH